MRRFAALLACVLVLLAVVSAATGAGRRFWHPYYVAMAGARTHETVLREIGPTRRPTLRSAVTAAGLSYPPSDVTLIGLKEERVLEVWARADAGWRRVSRFPVLAASGGPGPKLREGDLQVPEGVYRVTAFNPNSSYHLSLRVDYPNADDRAAARADGRTTLGGDIFIHGKAVSIGCLALGDAAIEELYVLLADVGLTKTRLVLAPSATPKPAADAAPWVAGLYARLARELLTVRGRDTQP